MQRVTQTEWTDLKRLFRLWSQQYCKEKSYWRIEGRPVFSILNLTDFAAHYGLTTFAMILLYARKVVFHTIGVNPFFIGVFSEANQRLELCGRIAVHVVEPQIKKVWFVAL